MNEHDDEKNRISLKDFRETFYECRNFEITHLWQRLVFLTAFIVICFTGYGNLYSLKFNETPQIENITFHLLSLGLAIMGIAFSVIWIAMGKGSKAWYEIYEGAICDIEENMSSDADNYKMGYLASFIAGKKNYQKSLNEMLTNNNAGAYSVSKLNIIFGQVLTCMWTVIFFIHLYFIVNNLAALKLFLEKYFILSNIIFSGACSLLIIYFIAKLIKSNSKSSAIQSHLKRRQTLLADIEERQKTYSGTSKTVVLDVNIAQQILFSPEYAKEYTQKIESASLVLAPKFYQKKLKEIIIKKKNLTFEERKQYINDGIGLIDEFINPKDLLEEARFKEIAKNHSIDDRCYIILACRYNATLISDNKLLIDAYKESKIQYLRLINTK